MSLPRGCWPSKTTIATFSEFACLKSVTMRSIALNDGASLGVSDTECSFSTCSSGGRPIVTMTVIANHAKIMGSASRWIVRATDGRPLAS